MAEIAHASRLSLKPYTPHPAFEQTDHRPWPLPNRNWLLKQQWNHLLFIHYALDAEQVRAMIPEPLEIDRYDGRAWLGVVPFDMKGVGLRGLPTLPSLSDFPEINLRTYVTYKGKPGVWFISLDVPHRIPVYIARTAFHLPYYYSHVRIATSGTWTQYNHRREDQIFRARYRPLKPVQFEEGSFETWATERYCLYSQSASGNLYRAEVQHKRWPLQLAEMELEENTMLSGFDTSEAHPSLLYSESLEVVAYRPQLCV